MKYVIFEEAQKILEKNGLNKRIQTYLNSENKIHFGYIYDDEIEQIITLMKKEGY